MLLPQLRRIRWAVRATLLLGVAASVLANILHALDNPISQAIAAWPPVALLLTVELISRVPVHRRLLAASRLIATAIIAGIAAWVSYWHMAGVAARYGETGASPYLLPLSVDGLIVVASICLVELSGRMASLEQPAGAATSHIMVDALPESAAAADRAASPDLLTAPATASAPAASAGATSAGPASVGVASAGAAPVGAASVVAASAKATSVSAASAGAAPVGAASVGAASVGAASAGVASVGAAPTRAKSRAQAGVATHQATPMGPSAPSAPSAPSVELAPPLRRSTAAALAEVAATLPRSTPFTPTVTRSGNSGQHLSRSSSDGRATSGTRSAPAQRRPGSSSAHSGKSTQTTRARRSPAETVALAARIKAERPTLTEAELAAELGISPSRWRTVRREAAAQSTDRQLAA